MTRLHRPDVRLWASWRQAVLEFGDEQVHGAGLWHRRDDEQGDLSLEGCARFVEQLSVYADPRRSLPEGWVHCDYYWVTDGGADQPDGPDGPDGPEEVVGFLALRHELNDYLLDQGGHIGYAVRPGRRREGHATRALALGVLRAAELGLERVLVTCDDDNLASAATIVGNDGVLEDVRQGKQRYWIATGAAAARGVATRVGSSAAPS